MEERKNEKRIFTLCFLVLFLFGCGKKIARGATATNTTAIKTTTTNSTTVPKYTISFDENGGIEVLDITQGYGTTITLPTTTKTGYSFMDGIQVRIMA